MTTFVLADLFEVEPMSVHVPDHVYEADTSFEWIPCPVCDGTRWIECYGSAWDTRNRPDLNFAYKPCNRCHQMGKVLDFPNLPSCLKARYSEPYTFIQTAA